MPAINREIPHRWLLELTQIPTAAGCERRVTDWITRWAQARPGVRLDTDRAGNLTLALRQGNSSGAPLYFTAHLDHPAFVVERIVDAATLQLAFRGGVMDDYFTEARVVIHAAGSAPLSATLVGRPQIGCAAFKSYLAKLAPGHATDHIRPGDIATWELPPARIDDGILHTHACDDLAAVAAALAAFHELSRDATPAHDVRLLFTRAEEVGFLGALAACRDGTIPRGARVIALENSRSFDDSPIGDGPIVRVGDRLSIFSPSMTAAVAAVAEAIAGGPHPTASQKSTDAPKWKWQRKLMAGGACEATVFCAYGHEATCVCLPLGNYHNMADLAAVQAGTNSSPPRPGPEFISISDFDGLVDLLIACGRALPQAPVMLPRLDRIWAEKSFVLEEP
jgi:putative aminopeptidase FrvX